MKTIGFCFTLFKQPSKDKLTPFRNPLNHRKTLLSVQPTGTTRRDDGSREAYQTTWKPQNNRRPPRLRLLPKRQIRPNLASTPIPTEKTDHILPTIKSLVRLTPTFTLRKGRNMSNTRRERCESYPEQQKKRTPRATHTNTATGLFRYAAQHRNTTDIPRSVSFSHDGCNETNNGDDNDMTRIDRPTGNTMKETKINVRYEIFDNMKSTGERKDS